MFLKVISANLRGSISICSAIGVTSTQILPVSRSKLLQSITIRSSSLQYSTGKVGSKLPKTNPANKNERISDEEIQILNQNPDNFGTLSSIKPSDGKKSDIVSSETEKKSISKKIVSKRKSIDEYETLLKSLAREKGVLEAVRVFEDEMLKTDRILAPIQIYEWLIEKCLRFNHYDKAFDLYEHMVNRGLKISLLTIEKLTVAFEKSSLSIKKVKSLGKILSKYEYKSTPTIYNAMIRIHNRAKQWPTGFELANEMVQHNKIDYEFDTINSMLDVCKYDKINGFNRLLELWHEMHRLRYTPNTQTLNALLNAVHRCGINDVDKLLETVESIKAKWQTVSQETNSMECNEIAKIEKESIDDGRPNLLKIPPEIGRLFPLQNVIKPEDRLLILGGITGIFEMIKTYEITPTLDTVKALLEVAPNSFSAQQRVIRLLKKYHIPPDVHLFYVLLSRVVARQNFEAAMEVIEMMYTLGVEVDLVSYGLLSMTCKTAEEAETFLAEIERNNVKMDEDILNSMLKNAFATADNDFVICILRKMQSKQIEPQEESIKLIEEYQQQVFRNLRTQRVHSKKTRNDCFKLIRECKQFLRHFQLDKRSANKLSKEINVPVESGATLKRNQTKKINRNKVKTLERKGKQMMDE